jgi:hypothetical protein
VRVAGEHSPAGHGRLLGAPEFAVPPDALHTDLGRYHDAEALHRRGLEIVLAEGDRFAEATTRSTWRCRCSTSSRRRAAEGSCEQYRRVGPARLTGDAKARAAARELANALTRRTLAGLAW